MHDRSMTHRIRRPWWQRLWMRLSNEQQVSIKSYWWSIAVNVSILLIMGLFVVSLPVTDSINLTLSLASSNGDEVTEDIITIEPEAENDEPEPEPEEVEPEPEPQAVHEPEDEAPPEGIEEPADPGDGQASSTPTDLSELTSNAGRISEVERRVASAGGGLDGPIRVSLAFSGDDDIDLHLFYKGKGGEGRRSYGFNGYVYYRKPSCRWGKLDVDSNARDISLYPAENIVFHHAPSQANYTVKIDHYRLRGYPKPTPYVVIVKYGRLKKVFEGSIMPGERMLEICHFSYRHR